MERGGSPASPLVCLALLVLLFLICNYCHRCHGNSAPTAARSFSPAQPPSHCLLTQTVAPTALGLNASSAIGCASECRRRQCCRVRIDAAARNCSLWRPAGVVDAGDDGGRALFRALDAPECPLEVAGTRFSLIAQRLTWWQSLFACRLRYGRLAELDTAAKVAFFVQKISDNYTGIIRSSYSEALPQIWIGAFQTSAVDEPKGNWVWAESGRALNFSAYPGAYCHSKLDNHHDGQQYLALYGAAGSAGFNDLGPNEMMYALCECL